MCTAVLFHTRDHYFGRTLDLEGSFGEQVTILPRNFPLEFRHTRRLDRHYAILGMAHLADGYPLWYEAVNEVGVGMAGLNFPGWACWQDQGGSRDNLAPFELIPWVLAQCADLDSAAKLLSRANLLAEPFSPSYPLTPLHWMAVHKTRSLVIEPLANGLALRENPVGVLTNAPPFDHQMTHLAAYRRLTGEEPACTFAPGLDLPSLSRGLGAMGLPGDFSSPSRFVRAAFTRLNARSGPSEEESVTRFFQIMDSVTQIPGCCRLDGGLPERTIYTSCCNTDRGIYYYTTCENRQITAVDLRLADPEGTRPVTFPLCRTQQIRREQGNSRRPIYHRSSGADKLFLEKTKTD